MTSLHDFWLSLGRLGRTGLAVGLALIVVLTIGVMSWLFRADDQVLFTDLKAQDAAAMVTELDRMKVPYRIGSDGNTILVDGTIVHATRLKLMGRDLPLHGAAGFELFNNSDFGMTEFAQKINYQRALQGEITRTILSLSQVEEARVHLALPEESLFKSTQSRGKAAIELKLHRGQPLRQQQVLGIQRLVAAAVPGISASDVTIVDQEGVALTSRGGSESSNGETGAGRLDLKRDTEKLLARKATEVLEKVFGAGQVLASVDVTLNMDQVRVTTEDVLGGGGRPGQAGSASGVVIREKESARDPAPPLGRAEGALPGTTQREVEYQVGRRVEQVSVQPGSIRQVQVVAVVRQALDDHQVGEMRKLVSAAVGAVQERGDTIVVESLKSFEIRNTTTDVVAGTPRAAASPVPVRVVDWRFVGAGADAVAVFLMTIAAIARSRNAVLAKRHLGTSGRQQVLEQIQVWIEHGKPASVVSGGAPK